MPFGSVASISFYMIGDVQGDMDMYAGEGQWFLRLGFWASATYRIGHLGHKVQSRPAKLALLTTHRVLAVPWRLFRSVYLPARAEIGRGLRIPHPDAIYVPSDSVIGDHVSIYHDVTLGTGPVPGVPRIGNRVQIFAGAKILGGITIGDDVQIGANAVVTRDVPAGAVVTAAPARIISAELAAKMPHRRELRGPNGELLGKKSPSHATTPQPDLDEALPPRPTSTTPSTTAASRTARSLDAAARPLRSDPGHLAPSSTVAVCIVSLLPEASQLNEVLSPRGPQSPQSVPESRAESVEPGPPSSHTPSPAQ